MDFSSTKSEIGRRKRSEYQSSLIGGRTKPSSVRFGLKDVEGTLVKRKSRKVKSKLPSSRIISSANYTGGQQQIRVPAKKSGKPIPKRRS